jgi:hypothetical protein
VETELWLRGQLARLPAVDYYHVIFTMAHELTVLWRYNRRRFSQLLFGAAWGSLRDLLADGRWLGALPGALGTLHTWDQGLGQHIHLHFLVTAGGVDARGRWKPIEGKYLVYSRALADLFRGKLLARLHRALKAGDLQVPSGMRLQQCHNLLNRVSGNAGCRWHVQIQPRYSHAAGVLKYLARYVRGGPMSERRVAQYDGHTVTVRVKKRDAFELGESSRREPIRISATAFVTRFLEHVPPRRLHTVRSFGLLHPSRREALNRLRAALGQDAYTGPPRVIWEDLCAQVLGHSPSVCPVCRQPLTVIARLAGVRSPPQAEVSAA